jgi:hypothetical protein
MTTDSSDNNQPHRTPQQQFPALVVQTQKRLLSLPADQQVTLLLILARELAAEAQIRAGRLRKPGSDTPTQTDERVETQRQVFEGFQQKLNRAILRMHLRVPERQPRLVEDFYRVASWFACEQDVLHVLERVQRNPLHEREECPCCGYFTLPERGGYDTCEVCFWEDEWPHLIYGEPPEGWSVGANKVTLDEARENFRAIGAQEERVKQFVRPPREDELPEQHRW